VSAGLPIRALALEVLRRVEREAAYSNRALETALERRPLDEADRRLCTELVYGVLRRQASLDFALDCCTNRPLADVEPGLVRVLRLAAYQLLYLERVPARAAVHTAVELARRARGERWARFANAVLRRLERERRGLPWPDWDSAPLAHLEVVGSLPAWLAERLLEQLGDDARALSEAWNRRPRLTIRATRRSGGRDALAALLAEQGIEAEPGRAAPDALRLRRAGPLHELIPFVAGELAVQDEASQLVTHLLDPQPGEHVLDACAAPGGKTGHIAERMDDRGRVDALDVHPGKLLAIRELCARLRLSSVTPREADATQPLSEVPAPGYDRVLVDAPCSNSGTIHRHPERRWRIDAEALPSLAGLQGALLDNVAAAVRPGGILVYSVCSVLREEAEAVTGRFLSAHPDFAVEPPVDRADLSWQPFVTAEGAMRTWPHRHETDGFYAVRYRRKEP
jgi:16S rRNA (cytosine967-C5)-methyltransferase